MSLFPTPPHNQLPGAHCPCAAQGRPEIEKGLMTTIHATPPRKSGRRHLLKNWRLGRTAAENIIPTTTARPKPSARFAEVAGDDGHTSRPIATGSVIDLTVLLKRIPIEAIDARMKRHGDLPERLLEVHRIPSSRKMSSMTPTHPSMIQSDLRTTLRARSAGCLYDNEWGYSNAPSTSCSMWPGRMGAGL